LFSQLFSANLETRLFAIFPLGLTQEIRELYSAVHYFLTQGAILFALVTSALSDDRVAQSSGENQSQEGHQGKVSFPSLFVLLFALFS